MPMTWTRADSVPASGIELLRSASGGNPHSLVADQGCCTWYSPVFDRRALALGILDAGTVAYLIHPEHGASGIAPGRYVIGRQRESVPRRHQPLRPRPRGRNTPHTIDWTTYVED